MLGVKGMAVHGSAIPSTYPRSGFKCAAKACLPRCCYSRRPQVTSGRLIHMGSGSLPPPPQVTMLIRFVRALLDGG